MCGAFLLGFLKIYDSPAKLLSLEVAIILFCAGQLIHWEIIRIECSHALSRKWTRSHQTVGMSLVELSARHVLTKFKTNFGFLRVAAGKRSSRAPPPPRTRVRKKGKFKGSQTGGGGPQRAFFSQRLKGVSTNSKDEKSATLVALHKEYRAIRAEGGARWKELVKLGQAGAVTHRFGRASFGLSRRERNQRNKSLHALRDDFVQQLSAVAVVESRDSQALCPLKRVRLDSALPMTVEATTRAAYEAIKSSVRATSVLRMQSCRDHIVGGASGDVGVHFFEPGKAGCTFYQMVPPVGKICERVLTACAGASKSTPGAPMKQLTDFWSEAHRFIKDDAAPLPTAKMSHVWGVNKVSLCSRLGKCVCGPQHRQLLQCRQALSALLHRVLKKGSKICKLYDSHYLVIRLFSSAGARVHHFARWYYVGMGNLTDGLFTLRELEPVEGSDNPSLAVLRSASGGVFAGKGRPMELFTVLENLPRMKTLKLELLQLMVDAAELTSDFLPLAVVGKVDADVMQVWPPPSAEQVAAVVVPDVAEEGELQDVDMSGDTCLLDLVSSNDEVIARMEPVRAELSSSDEEPVAPPERHRARVGRSPAATAPRSAGSSSGAVSVATAAAPQVQPPPGAFHARVCRVSRWPRVIHSPGVDGKKVNCIRMSQTWGCSHWDFKTICEMHGPLCGWAKNGRSFRPIGRMWAWLDSAHLFDSAEAHKAFVPALHDRQVLFCRCLFGLLKCQSA